MTDLNSIDTLTDKLETIGISVNRLISYNNYFYKDIQEIDTNKSNKDIMDNFYALSYAIETSLKDIKTELTSAIDMTLKMRQDIKK